jgi:hypothetical protein
MKKAKNNFVKNSISYYKIKSSEIPEYVRCERFMPNEWDNNLISVNQLVFVDGDFHDSRCIEIHSNELVVVSLEYINRLRETWCQLEKYFTYSNCVCVLLGDGTIRMEDLFGLTSDILKICEIKYKYKPIQRFGYVFTYGEYGVDDQLFWRCEMSDEVIY